jgi:hypothetical protein
LVVLIIIKFVLLRKNVRECEEKEEVAYIYRIEINKQINK